MKYIMIIILGLLYAGCYLPEAISESSTNECKKYLQLFKRKVWSKNANGTYSINIDEYNSSKLKGEYKLTCLKGFTEKDYLEYLGEPNHVLLKHDVFKQLIYYLDYQRDNGEYKYVDILFVYIGLREDKYYYIGTYPKLLNEPKDWPSLIL